MLWLKTFYERTAVLVSDKRVTGALAKAQQLQDGLVLVGYDLVSVYNTVVNFYNGLQSLLDAL